MGAAPNPRALTGRSGASSHVLRVPCGLSSGFPVARRVLPLRPPSSGFPSSGVLRFVPFGRCPVPVPPSVSLRVPFPLGNLHVSAAAARFRRRRSQAAGTKVTSSAATTSPGSRDPKVPVRAECCCLDAAASPSLASTTARSRDSSSRCPAISPDGAGSLRHEPQACSTGTKRSNTGERRRVGQRPCEWTRPVG